MHDAVTNEHVERIDKENEGVVAIGEEKKKKKRRRKGKKKMLGYFDNVYMREAFKQMLE